MTAGSRFSGCEMFAALLKADCTVASLLEVTGLSENNVRAWLREMRAAGLVYLRRGEKRRRVTQGTAPTLYCLQPKPFERADWS